MNDAYLAGLCGALRLYHQELGVLIGTLPMAVPVNLRSDADPAGGNRFAGVNPSLLPSASPTLRHASRKSTSR